jgi:hypothetical protein
MQRQRGLQSFEPRVKAMQDLQKGAILSAYMAYLLSEVHDHSEAKIEEQKVESLKSHNGSVRSKNKFQADGNYRST